jgi:hypothetical protein
MDILLGLRIVYKIKNMLEVVIKMNHYHCLVTRIVGDKKTRQMFN